MNKVIATRPIPEAGLNAIRDKCELTVHDDRIKTEEELKGLVTGAEIIISLLTDKITDAVMEAAGPQLKAICQYTVGYDNIDMEAAKRRGVIITNTPGAISGPAVAEHAVNLMFAVARHTVPADAYMRQGKYTQWDPNLYLGQLLMGKTVGIIGTGQIGSIFAGICHNGLKMKVLYTDMVRNEAIEKDLGALKVSQEQLLVESDVVSLHVPLLPSTKHLISREQFHIMKPTAILINTSRGPVVDEVAMVESLREKKIFGAGIDVFEFEPHLAEGLAELENVVVSPHIASATESTRIAMAEATARNVLAVLSGETPPNLVNN